MTDTANVRIICTYFDYRYLVRGLTLYRSLASRVENLRFWVLCLDEHTKDALDRLNWPGIRAVALAEVEQADPQLAASRQTRSTIEYYFTCTPAWIAYVLARLDEGTDRLAYVDADLVFYESPALLDGELDAASILLSGHGFADDDVRLERYGRFNVGFIALRRDAIAATAVQHWRRQCIEWCFDRVEDNRFADQKYLDEWPTLFPPVRELRHSGASLAPWNHASHQLSLDEEGLLVDGSPLVFFHFQGLRILLGGRWYDSGTFPKGSYTERLYGGYLRQLRETHRLIRPIIGRQRMGDSLRRPSWVAYAAGLIRRAMRLGMPIARARPTPAASHWTPG